MALNNKALLINPGNEKGLILIRRLVQSGYLITALSPDIPNSISTLGQLEFTNPELKDSVQIITFSNDIINDPAKIIEATNLLQLPPQEFLFSFNPTRDTFAKWDLNLIYALTKTNVVEKDSTLIVVGRDAENVPETENKALQKTMANLYKMFKDENITFVDLTEVGALPGDESYVVDTYMHEVIRRSFKVKSINSLVNIYKYIIYHYVPGFLLNIVIYFQSLLSSLLGCSEKSKQD